MKNIWKPTTAIGLTFALTLPLFSGCSSSSKGEQEFTMWIYNDDGQGEYYSSYEGNPVIQWLNNQYWDTENKTLGTEENGTKITLSFRVPIQGSESDNFNTMIGT